MKRLLFSINFILILSAAASKAQTKAQQDNNQFIAVVKTTEKNHQTHYKMTNNNSIPMDFSLYKEMKNGSWDVTHHLDLKPGETYEDIAGFTGYTGKYLVFSAPNSSIASFPYGNDVLSWVSTPPALPASPDPAPVTPATTTTPSITTTPASVPDRFAPDPPKTPKP